MYRLYEVVGVYDNTLKEVIQGKVGDGAMSAINFSVDLGNRKTQNKIV